jgi:glycosyltransferase involved in cell wall biosynthesis
VLGGSELEAQRVSQALQQRGHTVKILCAGGAPMPPVTHWVDPCGIPVRIFGGRWPVALRGYVFAAGVAWTLFKERGDYEIAYFLMHGLQLVSGLPVAGMLGKRIVMKFSCSGLVAQMTESMVGRLSLRFLRRWASRILILNPGMLEEAKQVGLDDDLMGWMPNPVDTDQFSPCSAEERARLRKDRNLHPETPVAVFVGRLDTQKELPWLVGAFALVVRDRPRATLVLIGDGPLRAQIEQLVRDLGLERNVIFTGRLDADGVIGWLRAGDVFTLISAVEGLPCALIEAMSVGVAPLVSNIPAHTQLIEDNVHGLVTETGNKESIARGLVRLIDDPQLRTRLGVAARRRMIDQYSTPQVANCYEALFTSVLAAESSARY